MSGLQPTPLAKKSPNDSPSAIQDTLKAVAEEAWRRELQHRVHVSGDDFTEYLRKYVPSNTPYPSTYDTDIPGDDLFAGWTPEPGKELDSYPHLVRG